MQFIIGRRLVCISLLALCLSALVACGGGGGGGSPDVPTATINRVVSSVTIIDGNNQSATVGTELPNTLVATIKNSEGQLIAGQTVNFKVVSGNGSVFAGAATSDANGVVRERWTLGTVAGPQKVEVRAVDATGAAVVYAAFDAIAAAGEAKSFEFGFVVLPPSGFQSGFQLQALSSLPKVIVKDAFGNPKSGILVTFTADSGGSPLPSSVVTDSKGEASTIWTLGLPITQMDFSGIPITPQILSATVLDLPARTLKAISKQAPAGAATTITRTNDAQTVVQHSLLPLPLQVRVTDALGNPVPNTAVSFSFPSGGVYVNPVTVLTDNLGNASWLGYFHASGQNKVNAIVGALPPSTFTTNVTASSHKYDGYYVCTNLSRMTILNGVILYEHGGLTGGTVNESNGSVSATQYTSSTSRTGVSGVLTVDALLRATGSGIIDAYTYPSPTPSRTWTCDRQ